MYLEISKGLETIFEGIGLGMVPHFGQLAIAAFICSLPFLLIIYALCYPDEEYQAIQERIKEMEEKEKKNKEAMKTKIEKKD
mmetsp:Transcript_10708/g.10588  ORF Transcript_10708/g.10588 Transcript_10708/m.10588 type:complete len:82 (+) Transcript_10708:483-728(+)